MYLLGLSVIYCAAYLMLFFGISFFFTNHLPKLNLDSLKSVTFILLFYFGVLVMSSLISDPEWSNRTLHTFGGGFLIVLVTFFAIKDSGTKINVFQFIIIGISIAALFGIANEIFEFILQNYFGFIFADSINDTWLDLISNSIGSILASVFIVPFKKSLKTVSTP